MVGIKRWFLVTFSAKKSHAVFWIILLTEMRSDRQEKIGPKIPPSTPTASTVGL